MRRSRSLRSGVVRSSWRIIDARSVACWRSARAAARAASMRIAGGTVALNWTEAVMDISLARISVVGDCGTAPGGALRSTVRAATCSALSASCPLSAACGAARRAARSSEVRPSPNARGVSTVSRAPKASGRSRINRVASLRPRCSTTSMNVCWAARGSRYTSPSARVNASRVESTRRSTSSNCAVRACAAPTSSPTAYTSRFSSEIRSYDRRWAVSSSILFCFAGCAGRSSRLGAVG